MADRAPVAADIARLVRAVQVGDSRFIAALAARAGPEQWKALVLSTANERTSETIVHIALQAEFALVSQRNGGSSESLQHALDRRRHILRTLLRSDGIAARWCPVVDAAHYRLLSSIKLLLASLSPRSRRTCLTEADSYRQTVLHVTAQAKAPGLARRLLLGDDAASLEALGAHIDVQLPLDRHVSVTNLNRATGVADLAMFLEAGSACGLIETGWLDQRDGRGRSPLHHACRAGRTAAVARLLAHGADGWLAEDESGATCGHLAAARGYRDALAAWADAVGNGALDRTDAYGRSVRSLLDSPAPEPDTADGAGCEVVGEAAGADAEDGSSGTGGEPSSAARECDAGWLRMASSHATSLEGLADGSACFEHPPAAHVPAVRASELTRAAFVERFESRGLPVLLLNATSSWAALGANSSRQWTRHYLLGAEASQLPVAVSALPYQQAPPTAESSRHTLAHFLQTMREGSGLEKSLENSSSSPRRPPPFVFDNGRLLSTSLRQDVRPHPAVLQVEAAGGGAVLEQLSVSPPLAGAHPHFHGAVYNGLVVGVRRWALVPPAHATFSLEPALEYFSALRDGRRMSDDEAAPADGVDPPNTPHTSAPWHDVVQRAGDVLFVPPQWQHSTLSLSESVAVAVEFV